MVDQIWFCDKRIKIRVIKPKEAETDSSSPVCNWLHQRGRRDG